MIYLAGKSFITSLIAGLIIIIIGLLSAIIGIISIVNNEIEINMWIIIFALFLLNSGIACVIGGIGHIFSRDWASKFAYYGSIFILAINVIGILHLGGFVIKALYVILTMIASMWIIWYMSKKELGTFFLLSVAEHTIIIIIIIMLIYSGPIDTISQEKAIDVSIEELKTPEPDPPLIKLPQPKKKPKQEDKLPAPEKQKDQGKPVEPPKLQLKIATNIDQGSKMMASAPRLPKTFADITDSTSGKDIILRAPGPDNNIQRSSETVSIPDKSVSSNFKGAKNPESGIAPPIESTKGKGGSGIGRETAPSYGSPSFSSESKGTSTGANRPSFIGDIRGEVAGRKVVSWPRLPDEMKGTEGGTAILEITVDPAGNVTKVKIVKKSGSPKLDRVAMNYVEQIRFEQLPKNVQQITQRGEIVINFELAK